MKFLCVNAGSSSLKFQLFEMPEEKVIMSGNIERIGLEDSFWTTKINGEKYKGSRYLPNHKEAAQVLIEELLLHHAVSSLKEIKGVGHRILHGSDKYHDSVLIDDELLQYVKNNEILGPLHHVGNLAGIEAMMEALPGVPMVAVFDSTFHQTIPKENYMYPIPYEWYENYGIRKYGFHGINLRYIIEVMQKKLHKESLNLIVCHLGSGASISAIKNNQSFDTTMGFTPLDGLMMGTRTGSMDPSILEYVSLKTGKSIEDITYDLNNNSGFLGVCGFSDNRDVEKAMAHDDERAILAFRMFTSRVAKYIADYYIELSGRVDAIVFTAGIGENGILVREDIMRRIASLGITLDEEANNNIAKYKDYQEGRISGISSKIDVWVIPADEELIIMRDTYKILKNQS